MKKVKRGFNFNTMEFQTPGYSRFNLSHDRVQSLAAGELTPLWWTEIVPGDIFQLRYSGFMRLLALSSPMLQRNDIFIRAFFVPFRILANQDDIDKLFAGSKSGEHLDTPFFEFPNTNSGKSALISRMKVGSLYDALECPLPYVYNSSTGNWEQLTASQISAPDDKPLFECTAFPFLAYQRIYHDHFRNEETEDDYLDAFKQMFENLDAAPFTSSLNRFGGTGSYDTLRKVCWERDYFTSALSQPQRGQQVNIPLVGSASVTPNATTGTAGQPTFNPVNPSATSNLPLYYDAQSGRLSLYEEPGSGDMNLTWNNPKLSVSGSSFSGIGAVALRLAMNLQAFLERNNIAGYRMIGNTLAHFGVRSSNKLNDEAQYLGGIKAPITISAINQTSATESGSTPQGNQVGQGIASFSDTLFNYFRSEERGILMVVGYVNAKSSYSQGLPRKFTRRSYLDYYWPEFQTIGEQEIENKELYYSFSSGQISINDRVWAYQSRYSEYKYEPDSIGGDFRTTLSYWHQSRLFNYLPAFNDQFVKSNPSDRVFALSSELYPRPYLLESYFEVNTVRPMSKYAQSKLW